MDLNESIAANLADVRERIAAAARNAGRRPAEVTLVASRRRSDSMPCTLPTLAGQREFGENKVQEALQKIADQRPILGIAWHLIGHLQSNKARKAGGAFAAIHSIDSVDLLAQGG